MNLLLRFFHFHYEIKPTPPKRRTLRQDIAFLVKGGELREAEIAAECGHKLSSAELALYWRYTSIFTTERGMMHPAVYRNWRAVLDERERVICTMFLEAVRSFDRDKIVEIAEAVWFMKSHFKSNNCVDNERRAIVSIMGQIDSHGGKMTIQDLAHLVGTITNKKIIDQGDGYSALRRKALDLGFPLAASRKIRKKKSK